MRRRHRNLLLDIDVCTILYFASILIDSTVQSSLLCVTHSCKLRTYERSCVQVEWSFRERSFERKYHTCDRFLWLSKDSTAYGTTYIFADIVLRSMDAWGIVISIDDKYLTTTISINIVSIIKNLICIIARYVHERMRK